MLKVCTINRQAGAHLVGIAHLTTSPVTKLAEVGPFSSSRAASYRHVSLSSPIAALNIVDLFNMGVILRNHRQMGDNLRCIQQAIVRNRS